MHWLKAYSLLLGSLNLPTQIVVCCSGELEIALVVIMSWMLHPANSSSLSSCVLSLFGCTRFMLVISVQRKQIGGRVEWVKLLNLLLLS